MSGEARRERLVQKLADEGIDALLSTHLPNVRYLSGFSGSNGQVVVAGSGGRFFTDGRYTEQSSREVPDMERVTYGRDWIQRLGEACTDLGVKRLGFESEYVVYKEFERLGEVEVELVPTKDLVGGLRWIKDDEELGMIQKAQDLTDEGFAHIIEGLREGMTERDLALELDWAMLRAGADGVAFETIAAFGENAAEPHHSPVDRKLRRGDMVKLDFGALYAGYHADMTRTVAFGDPGEEMTKVYEIVREAQQVGIDAVREGITGGAADRASRAVIDAAGYGERFSHSLGHGVGLEIHEGPTLTESSEEILPVNTVVTVEPGIYLPGIGGVRIEDMVVVGSDGCRSMASSGKELMIL